MRAIAGRRISTPHTFAAVRSRTSLGTLPEAIASGRLSPWLFFEPSGHTMYVSFCARTMSAKFVWLPPAVSERPVAASSLIAAHQSVMTKPSKPHCSRRIFVLSSASHEVHMPFTRP